MCGTVGRAADVRAIDGKAAGVRATNVWVSYGGSLKKRPLR
jgi:hypothetical protein